MESTQAQSLFFSRLPPEIRNQIYGLARPSSGFLLCLPTNEIIEDTTFNNPDIPSILITCKKAYNEAYPVLCGLVEIEAKGKACELCKVSHVGDFVGDKFRHLSIIYRGDCRYHLDEEFGDYLHFLVDQFPNIRHLSIEVKGAKSQCAPCIQGDLEILRPAIQCMGKLQSVGVNDNCGTEWLEIFQNSFSNMLKPVHRWDHTLPPQLVRIPSSPLSTDDPDSDSYGDSAEYSDDSKTSTEEDLGEN
ncbi:hypothetical protein F5Y04DRAFT_285643 [Hypomontagnella monticulosa]|nr:hypothetical protein F5Y04DRAFT_285643 [Hypomontagnella monticulosa]